MLASPSPCVNEDVAFTFNPSLSVSQKPLYRVNVSLTFTSRFNVSHKPLYQVYQRESDTALFVNHCPWLRLPRPPGLGRVWNVWKWKMPRLKMLQLMRGGAEGDREWLFADQLRLSYTLPCFLWKRRQTSRESKWELGYVALIEFWYLCNGDKRATKR